MGMIFEALRAAPFPSPFALSRKRERGTVGVALCARRNNLMGALEWE